MSLITRAIINRNIKIKSLKYLQESSEFVLTEIDYDQIINGIDRVKTYLILEKNCQPGDKVLLALNVWPHYLIWFIAISELGMSFVVSDYPNIENSLSVANKLSLYGDIKYLISSPRFKGLTYYSHLSSKFVDCSIFTTYENTAYKHKFDASPDSILLYSTSSGTTSTPKIIEHTHKFFYDLLERNAKLYNLKETDRCLHSKGLHHGSVTGVYFLPTLKYCSYHYYAQVEMECVTPGVSVPHNWVDLIQKEKINRCLMFYNMTDDFCRLALLEEKKHNELTVFVLAKITQTHLDVIVKKFNYKIMSIFGCTETSGPLFLPEIDINTVDNCNLNDFGTVLDDFYRISIDAENSLIVEMPDGKKILTGDKFSMVKNNFIFHGRENLYRLNGKPFYLDLLILIVEQITGLKNSIGFDIVVDQNLNQIYIRSTDDINLEKLNADISKEIKGDESYQINKKIVAPRDLFFNGIKFDAEEVRLRCRLI